MLSRDEKSSSVELNERSSRFASAKVYKSRKNDRKVQHWRRRRAVGDIVLPGCACSLIAKYQTLWLLRITEADRLDGSVGDPVVQGQATKTLAHQDLRQDIDYIGSFRSKENSSLFMFFSHLTVSSYYIQYPILL